MKKIMIDCIEKVLDDYIDEQFQKTPKDLDMIKSLIQIQEYTLEYHRFKGTRFRDDVRKSLRKMIDYYMDREVDDWLKKNRPRIHNYRLLIVIDECLCNYVHHRDGTKRF